MTKRSIVTLLVVLIALGAATTVVLAKLKDPFVGAWESIDADGSHQWMWIEPDLQGVYSSTYYDDMATGCGGPEAIAFGAWHMVSTTEYGTDNLIAYCFTEQDLWFLTGWAGWTDDPSLIYDETTDELVDPNIIEWPPDSGQYHQTRWHRSNDDKPEKIIGGY